jgi:uncharacterized protein YkwD
VNLLDILFGRVKLVPPLNKPPPGPVPTPVALTDPEVAALLLVAHNAERKAHGLPPFRINAPLLVAAQKHAKQMDAYDRLSHDRVMDGDPWQRYAAEGYRYRAASENIAKGQRSPAEVMADWMGSPGHRANVLGPYVDFGGAMSGGYWCACFGSPLAGHSEVVSLARLGPASETHAFASEITQAVKELGGWV